MVSHVSWKDKPRDIYFLRDFEDEKKKYYFRELALENQKNLKCTGLSDILQVSFCDSSMTRNHAFYNHNVPFFALGFNEKGEFRHRFSVYG